MIILRIKERQAFEQYYSDNKAAIKIRMFSTEIHIFQQLMVKI